MNDYLRWRRDGRALALVCRRLVPAPTVTADEWHARAAQAGFDGAPLTIGAGEYAELVRLRLAHDPLNFADHTADLDGVPIILDQGAP